MTKNSKPPMDQQMLGGDHAATHAINKHPAAVALGRLGGLKGGRARAARLSPEERQKIAREAAAARWRKKDGHE